MGHQYMYKSQALRSSTTLGQIVIYLLSTAATASKSAIYAPVICIHCSPLRHSELIVKYNICLKTLLQQGISEPVCYGDLVYKFKRIVGKPNFSD